MNIGRYRPAACAVAVLLFCLSAGTPIRGQRPVIDDKVLDGTGEAAEFPEGLSWLNTSAPIRLKDLRGKFVILDFWTYCCINCMHVIPELKRLENKYSQTLVVIGVHSAKFQNEKDTEQIREAVVRYDVRHPVVNDADLEIFQTYGANSWPTLVVINPEGKMVGKLSGESFYSLFDEVLTKGTAYFSKKDVLKRGPSQVALEAASRAETVLAYPGKISADTVSHRLAVSDSNHNRILITDPAGKILEIIGSGDEGDKDGSFEEAEFHHPQGTYLLGTNLYIADTENHLIRLADLKTRRVTTVLGTGDQARERNQAGQGTSVALNSPWDVLAKDGKLYIAMAGPHQIWVADLNSWETKPYAGSGREEIENGKLAEAALAQPSGLATDGQALYSADSESSSIRKIDLDPGGSVSTIVGRGLFVFGDTDGTEPRLQHPLGVAFHDGMLYVADTYNSKIKIIDPVKKSSASFAGSGKKTFENGGFDQAAFNEPGGLAWLDGKLYVADTNNHLIRILDPKNKTVSSLELTGLDALTKRRTDHFKGRAVSLGAFEVKPGGSSLDLNFRLPPGYKFNKDAPFFLRWSSADAAQVQFAKQPGDFDFHHTALPIRIPVSKVGQATSITLETIVYYCTSEASACYVDPIQASAELRPSASAPAAVAIQIPVRDPATRRQP